MLPSVENAQQPCGHTVKRMRRFSGNASWDALAKTDDIDVRCGYVLGSVDREQEKDIVERICAEHSAVH